MVTMLDLEPATSRLAGLLDGVRDDQLSVGTPCERYTLGDLIDHIDGLSYAFTEAAGKRLDEATSRGGEGDAARLGDDWRTRIPRRLADLAAAWRDPQAWTGMTRAGGVDLPGDVAGAVALNEVVVHSWDVAAATGQPYESAPELLDACVQFVSSFPASREAGEGPFGPPVEVPADAAPLDRLVGLTGRDPSWQPA